MSKDSLDVQLLGLQRQRSESEIDTCRGGSPFEHVVPERDPGDAARQAIADLAADELERMPASIVGHEDP